MKVLIVGSGQGSWSMRGRQLGAAIGARVTTSPSADDFAWADLVVLVKRAGVMFADQARRHGLPIVWDALDFWRQPSENHVTEPHAKALLENQAAVIRPALTIGATGAMATACGGAYVPHHSWAGLAPTPARESVQTVAYEGNEQYLGRWHGWIKAECQARGWAFVVNPPDLSVADLIVAFRDGPWDGWICREWKSGVKIVNAIAAGRPLISQHSAARRELQPSGSVVESQAQLAGALDALEPLAVRAAVVERSRSIAQAFTLASVAAVYRDLLITRRAQWAA